MSTQVCLGAQLKCSFGAVPTSLVVIPDNMVNASKLPAAVIEDNIPIENIPTFGMCSCPANPEVIAATAAALGVFTPAPCIPVTPASWTPGSSKVKIRNIPALTNQCKLNCIYGGIIEIVEPGQFTVNTE
ncbi:MULTISPECIES: DUF4280 domain-containing protein [unclassified Francisella]|uniref:DUF4280 domain-containing protein n=1 Tax=unclassified Francisella TaxID=2610885 RepID=UPI002E3126AE|nr:MULTISPECIES: DUF4280 domain-containing protein [unclassified Francisella]MED7818891.1 DUF4280 domain-containing protein [Francisella sp. 19S2-4]MED7829728.1 DUF4280 domain-containing protein [Francisella sp. 19S2-10]